MLINYALVVNTEGTYPGLGGTDEYLYDIGDVVNLILLDTDTSTYLIPTGITLTDNTSGTYIITDTGLSQ